MSCKNLGQYRQCLINGILNNLAPHKVMLVPGYRNSTVHALETSVALRKHPQDMDCFLHKEHTFIFSAITHTTTFLLKSSPPHTHTHKITSTHFHSPQCSCLQWLYIWINQRQLTFLDTVAMGLITDMQTYKSLNVVQHLFQNTLYCTL
jgi:hypothetical protein